MHHDLLELRASVASGAPRIGQALQRRRIARSHRSRCLRLDQSRAAAFPRHDEVHFETLLVAEVVKLASATRIGLSLDDFRADKTLE